MPDDDEALIGATDTVKPWTIKAISTQARDQAIAAARQEGITVGQWLERQISVWTAFSNPDNQTRIIMGSNDAGSFASIAEMARLAIALSDVAPERFKDPVVRTARATVRAALLTLRPEKRSSTPNHRTRPHALPRPG